jgi:hypothetical protein
MMLNFKKEVLVIPKTKNIVRAKKVLQKGIHRSLLHPPKYSTIFWWPKTLQVWRQQKYPCKNAPRRSKLGHYTICQDPLITESAIKT